MRIKFYIAAICCLALCTSFSHIATPHAATSQAIIVEGYFNDGNVIVTIDYNPGLHKVVSVSVYSPYAGVGYPVTGYVDDTRVTYSDGTLTCNDFIVSYTIPGYINTFYTSWTGPLN